MASLLHRTARWIAHHPVWGLLLWLVIVASLTGAVTVFGAQTSNDTSLPGTQSQDAINVLAAGRETGPMKQFLQPFAPGADRFAGLELDESPSSQPILPEALAWLEATVQQRMECGDHWLLYAQVSHGGVLDGSSTTAVHQRRSGANY